MSLAVLVETDGEVGRVGELEKMRVAVKQLEDGRDDFSQVLGGAIESHDKPIVREWGFDNFIQRLLGGNVLPLLQDDTGNRFGVSENWFPTFGVISVFKFQGTEDL